MGMSRYDTNNTNMMAGAAAAPMYAAPQQQPAAAAPAAPGTLANMMAALSPPPAAAAMPALPNSALWAAPYPAAPCPSPPQQAVQAFLVHNSPQAPAGQNGAAGAKGAQGSHSVMVLPGLNGAQGNQGAKGANTVEVHIGCPGKAGPCGPQGDPHPRATQLAAQGVPKVMVSTAALAAGGQTALQAIMSAAQAAGIRAPQPMPGQCGGGLPPVVYGAATPSCGAPSNNNWDCCSQRLLPFPSDAGYSASATAPAPWHTTVSASDPWFKHQPLGYASMAGAETVESSWW